MNLSSVRTMDPDLLPGLVNTALRNDCDDLDDLLRTHNIEREVLETRMAELGLHYIAEINQFRAIPGNRGPADRS